MTQSKPKVIDLTMEDNNLALLQKHKIDKELLRTASLVPAKTLGATGGNSTVSQNVNKDVTETFAFRTFALRA